MLKLTPSDKYKRVVGVGALVGFDRDKVDRHQLLSAIGGGKTVDERNRRT
jgi:hypothetical protein